MGLFKCQAGKKREEFFFFSLSLSFFLAFLPVCLSMALTSALYVSLPSSLSLSLSIYFSLSVSKCVSVCFHLPLSLSFSVCAPFSLYLSMGISVSEFPSLSRSSFCVYFFFSPSLSLFLPVSIYLNRLPFAHRCHSLSPHPFSSTHKHSIRIVIPDLRHIRPRVVEAPLCHRSRYRYTFPVYFPSTRVTSLRNPTAQPGLRDSHGGKKRKKTFRSTIFGIFSTTRIAEL